MKKKIAPASAEAIRFWKNQYNLERKNQ